MQDLDLAELIGLSEDDLDTLEDGTRDIRIPCPAHDGDDDNMSIKLGDQGRLLFKCYSHLCPSAEIVAAIRGGEAITSTQHRPRLRPVPDLPKPPPPPTPRVLSKLEEANEKWVEALQQLDDLHPALVLLAERGITREDARKLEIGYGTELPLDGLDEAGLLSKNRDGSTFQAYVQRVTIPLIDEHHTLLGFAGRDVSGKSSRKWINPDSAHYDKSSFLYGENHISRYPGFRLVICEGFWDQIAVLCRTGTQALAVGGTSLTDRQIAKIAEINPELVIWAADGDVPGRIAAAKGAAKLAKAGLGVSVITAPDGKDPGDWGDDALDAAITAATPATVSDLIALALMGVDLDDETAKKSTANVVKQILKDWPDIGEAKSAMTPQLAHSLGLKVAGLRAATQPTEEEEKQSATVKMLGLAESMYEIFCDHSGELWNARAGSHIVKPFSPNADEVVNRLLAAYFATYDEAPPSRIASDALRYLAGQSYDSDRITVSQRVTEVDEVIYVDLGRKDEQVLVIEAGQTPVVDSPPEGVYFSRRGKYGELPIPEKTQGVTIDTLWEHIRVAETDRPIVLAWLFAAWSPSLQTPILLLEGAQGAAKSTSTRRLLSLLDPVPRGDSGLKSPPKDNSELIISLGASRVVAIDNLSYINAEMQNTLCQAATGGEAEGRKLYSNDEVFTINLKSSVILTGLDLGVLHGDLASRVAGITLDPVPRSISIPDDLLEKQWAKVHPGLVWEIAGLMSKIMAVMPTLTLKESPRMASFGRILAAVDQIMGTNGLSTYMLAEGERQKDVALTDPVATEIIHWMTDRSNWLGGRKPEWSGSSTELLNELNSRAPWKEGREPKGWPSSANALGMRVTKLKIPMATEGIDIDKGRGSSARIITIRLLNDNATPSVRDDDEEDKEVTPAPRKARAAKPVEDDDDEFTF